jgi:outer membrane cobalamin receptor
LTLEILGELKSQSLTQIIDLQQDFFGIEKRRWQLANIEDVPLITSEQVSVGLTYSNNNWLVSAETYIKNVKDITARSQGFQNQFQFINDIGSYTVKGVEFLINKRFKNISTWLSYTYSKNNYSFDNLNNGKEFANTLDLRHVANASLTYQLNNFKIGLGVNWNSGRPYTRPDDFQDEGTVEIEYQSPNSSRLPNYFRTDISALYMVNLSNKTTAEFGASIWNIFNQNNIINRFYTLDETNTIIKVDNQSLAFTPNFSLRVRF